ncbi:hypothetical protein [Streptomyces decoyicus]
MSRVLFPVVVLSLTRSALGLSAVALAGTLPWSLLSMPIGALVTDRVRRDYIDLVIALENADQTVTLGSTSRSSLPARRCSPTCIRTPA